ncbi:MAG: hypothetical protein HOP09_14240 [Hyphomicrobium sp.]|nr:hypothetical protein [Hyphomicrobium sp.]
MLSVSWSVGGGPANITTIVDETNTIAVRDAIQAALDSAAAAATVAQPATVTLSAGTFVVSADGLAAADGILRVGSNTTFEGADMALNATGPSTTIALADGTSHSVTGIVRTDSGETNPTLQSTANVTVRNLTIDGNNANIAAGIEVDGFYTGPKPGTETATDTNITVDNVEIKNMSRYGFDPHEQTIGLSISNSVARDNGRDGFAIDFCQDVTLTNNHSYNNGQNGFNIVTSSSNVTMTGNISYNNAKAGIAVQTGNNEARALTENVTILGGQVYGNGGAGIAVRQADSVRIGVDAANIVNGVQINGNAGQGILIEGSSNVTVQGNTVAGNATDGTLSGGSDAEIRVKGYVCRPIGTGS